MALGIIKGCLVQEQVNAVFEVQPVQVWVRDVLEAQQVEYQTGQRFKNSEASPLHNQPFGVVSNVFSHQSAQA
ncbi:TPA: hypothetical protein ACH3X3_012005 [Trebouxia sp. C0006]